MKNSDNVIWGILLVIIGVIFGLNAVGLTTINVFFEGWWTLFLIVPAVIGLIKEQDKTGSLIMFTIGVVLLLAVRDIIDFEIVWKLLFPCVLVIWGGSLVFKGFTGKDIKDKIKEINVNKEDILHVDAIFSGEKRQIEESFSGAEINAIFGSLDLSLTKVNLKNDVVISASSIFGGINLYLPENVNVVINSTNIFGGVENKYVKKASAKITVYISATCLFGGVSIK